MPKQILGRGLSSLIPKREESAGTKPAQPSTTDTQRAQFVKPSFSEPRLGESVYFVETEKVHPNPHQPRRDFDEEGLKDLGESIRRHGIIQPLVVTKHEHQTARGQEVLYELVAGERRLRAAELIGLKHVPVVIREAAEQQKLEVALVENLQRHNLSPLEEARAFRKLMDVFGLSQQEVASRVGKARPSVANTMRLLDLPQEVQKGLGEAKVSEGHARAILGLKDPVQQLAIYREILEKNLNVRDVEEVVRNEALRAGTRKLRAEKDIDPEVREFQTKLASALGTKVKVKGNPTRGKIVVEFYSREELRNIVDKMAGAV